MATINLMYLPSKSNLHLLICRAATVLNDLALTEEYNAISHVGRKGYYSSTVTLADGWYTVDIYDDINKMGDGWLLVEGGEGTVNDPSAFESLFNVTISPAVAIRSDEPVPRTNLTAVQYEVDPEFTIYAIDASGANISLTGKDLYIVIRRADGSEITLTGTQLTITDNAVTFALPSSINDVHGRYSWALRESTNKRRYGHGFLTVVEVPV